MTVTYHGIINRKGKNTKGIRTYVHIHKLSVDTKANADEFVVGSNANLPKIGSRHPTDLEAFCNDLSIDQIDKTLEFHATASFSSEVEMSENPLFEPADIEWDGENFEEVALYDNTGDAILNSAGDPYPDAFRERTRRSVTVTKNIGSVPTWIITAEDAVNSSDFLLDGFTVSTGLAKLGAPKLSKWQKRNGIRFRVMTMNILLNKDGWNLEPLDRGFRYRDGSDELVRATSDDGTDVSQPVCLDGSGGLLSDPTPSTAVFGDHDVYPALDFNTLPLT